MTLNETKELPFTFLNANFVEFHPGTFDMEEIAEVTAVLHQQYMFVTFWTKMIRHAEAGGFTEHYNYRAEVEDKIQIGEDLRSLGDAQDPDDGNLTLGLDCRQRWEEIHGESEELEWTLTPDFMSVLTPNIELAKEFRTFIFENYLSPKIEFMRGVIKYDEGFPEEPEESEGDPLPVEKETSMEEESNAN